MSTPAPGGTAQLDLFLDGTEVLLVHEVVSALLAREWDRSDMALRHLRGAHPACADLPSLVLLFDAITAPAPPPPLHGALSARIEEIEQSLLPAARRVLGADAGLLLRPVWQSLARAAAPLRFDVEHPRAHQSWLSQQYGDWRAVGAAVEREPQWATEPLLRYWRGLALHYLGEPDAAIVVLASAGLARSGPARPAGAHAAERDGSRGMGRLRAILARLPGGRGRASRRRGFRRGSSFATAASPIGLRSMRSRRPAKSPPRCSSSS